MFDLPSVPTGLHASWGEVRDFLLGVRFARRDFLWLTLIPAVLSLVGIFAARRTRRDAAAIGTPGAVAALLVGRRKPSRLGGVCLFLAWTLLVFGAAGPRWGLGGEPGVAVGRDVVVVLDLSQSMLANDAAAVGADHHRWRAARAGALDLVETLRARGGHRAAVVIFAARPKLLAPLTTDYDHLAAKLRDLDLDNRPAAIAPPPNVESASGTRIGAALVEAVKAHDPTFQGYQDVILLSDGDDPAPGREWETGVSAAQKAEIPVHTVGIGNPDNPAGSPLVSNGKKLQTEDEKRFPVDVLSKFDEPVLKEIAAGARGLYLPARTNFPAVGEFFRTKIEPQPSRVLSDDLLPQPKDRSAWFLAAGLVFLIVGWLRGR
jgi:Ca-activated chloride channel family protein